MADKRFLGALNVKKKCDASGVSLWQCPHFLFIIMGAVIILAILATDIVARMFAEPEVAALIALLVSVVLFIIGHVIVRSFENIVEASRLKSEFVSIVSHELRSPLSAVKWSLDLLRSDVAYKNIIGEVSSILSSIGEQNEKMIQTVNLLLEVRRVEENRLDLEPQKVFLKEITDKVMERLFSFARASNIKIELEAEGKFAAFVDPKKISFVILGLLENALRYSPGGSSVKIDIFDWSGKVFWRVTDRGAGIPEADRSKIFDKFFRAHNVFRYRSGGLGISLFLSKAFVEASGGKIGFSSEENKGSVFWFYLPVAENKI
ncbi:MAG: HAMP domain-containing sensor histidine kinase [Patescibacteria group bacterium]